jgi:hypothetical protein
MSIYIMSRVISHVSSKLVESSLSLFIEHKMAKGWSKRFNSILVSKKAAWQAAKKGSQRDAIVKEVAKAIHDEIAKSNTEDPVPPQLEKVSHVLASIVSLIDILFRKSPPGSEITYPNKVEIKRAPRSPSTGNPCRSGM